MNKKRLKQLREIAKKGGQSTLHKYGNSYFSNIAKDQIKKRMKGMTKSERSEMMRCVRMKQYGWKWFKEQRKCELGLAFSDNVKKNTPS